MVKNAKLIFIAAAIFYLAGCANQMVPVGGDVDKIPPEVIESYPKDRTTNYSEKYFELKFSEYVDKLSVQNAIFISPAIENGVELDWSGKSVTIEFQSALQTNTTYTVTVGTDVIDLNNRNKMVQPFTFAFSTGEKIDTGKISGKVFDSKVDGVMIYAYQTSEQINFAKQKPNYVSQVDKQGKYNLVGLRNGEYKILSMRDKMSDMLYQRNEDEFGVQAENIELKVEQNVFTNIDFMLSKEDTITPKLNSAFMKDRNHLVVEFNEAIDSTKININNFVLVDTTSNKNIIPKFFYKHDAKPNQFYLAFSDTNSFQDYVLTVKDFSDFFSNKTVEDKISFVYKAEKDTTANKLYKVFGDMPNDKVDFEKPVVKVQFVDGISLEDVKQRIVLEDLKKQQLEFNLIKVDDALFQLNISIKLKQSSEYVVKFNAKNLLDISGKDIDTVYQQKFYTTSDLDFSGVSGEVESNDSITVAVLQSVAAPKKTYQQKVDKKKKFEFKKVIPGKYLVWSFKDKNKNDKYDFGSVNPFGYAEEFKFYNDTLNLRARWPVGDVKIKYDN